MLDTFSVISKKARALVLRGRTQARLRTKLLWQDYVIVICKFFTKVLLKRVLKDTF